MVVQYLAQHPKYGKYLRKRTVLHVHDERNESKTGDRVEVAPCRPMSKTKSWRLVRVVNRMGVAGDVDFGDVPAEVASGGEVEVETVSSGDGETRPGE